MTSPKDINESSPRVTERFYDYSGVQGFHESYVNQFYRDRPVSNDEKAVSVFMLQKLRRCVAARQSLGRYLEIGCGPTVHHAILLAPYFETMHLSDYLPGNRHEVERWIAQDPGAVNWEQYTAFLLESEGQMVTPQKIKDREELTRQRIERVVFSNLMETPIVSTGDLYDGVGCFYCLEEVARTPEAFRSMIRNVAELIRPGGCLMIAALRSTDFYHVKGQDGQNVEFPCLAVSEALVGSSLQDAHFTISPGDLISCDVDGQAEEGVPGVILAFAIRSEMQ